MNTDFSKCYEDNFFYKAEVIEDLHSLAFNLDEALRFLFNCYRDVKYNASYLQELEKETASYCTPAYLEALEECMGCIEELVSEYHSRKPNGSFDKYLEEHPKQIELIYGKNEK